MAGEVGNVLDALLAFLARLETTDLRYAVGGSLASSLFGEPRAAADTDVVVDLPRARLPELLRALGPDFHVPADTAARAEQTGTFPAIHLPTGAKVDVLVAGPTRVDREQFVRRLRLRLRREGPEAWLAAPEVLVVKKLEWFRRGEGLSERQWRDVLGLLKVQAGRLDEAWMQDAARELGVADLLERALRLEAAPVL